jgi:hypothetical protein
MQQRIDTKTSHHRTGLALFEVFRAVHASVLSWRDVHAQCIAVVHHDAITVDDSVLQAAIDEAESVTNITKPISHADVVDIAKANVPGLSSLTA